MVGGTESRQRRIARHYLIDGAASDRLQQTVTLAASALDFPQGQLNILDDDQQHTISGVGAPTSMPRSETMCQFTMRADGVVAVDDMTLDPRCNRLPGVLSGAARSYLGVPLLSREATPVGTLCVFDARPRSIDAEQITRMRQFGAIVEDQLDLVRRASEQTRGHASATALSAAIDNDEIVPWYQPIVDLDTNRVIGHEALARWYHRTGEIEDPARFVRLAEDSDLVVDLDRAVMRRAVADLARWQRTDPAVRLNVNLSTRHLALADGVDALGQIAADAGVDPAAIDLELTESRELVDQAAGQDAVLRLRDQGFRVLLDDFGNGWSSLEWVLRLPVTGIKLDRAVTAGFGSPVGDAIGRALVALTNEVNLDVVVEGISNGGHVEAARALGCRYGQGYHWSPPVPEPFALSA